MLDPARWLLLTTLALWVWYLIDWQQACSAGRVLSPLRHPALLLARGIGSLVQARAFLLPVLAIWLASGAVWWTVQRPAFMRQMGAVPPARSEEPARPRMDAGRNDLAQQPPQSVAMLAQAGWAQLRTPSGRALSQACYQTVPRLTAVGSIGWPGHLQMLLLAAYLLVMAWAAWNRPPWLSRVGRWEPWLALGLLLLPVATLFLATWPPDRPFPLAVATMTPALTYLGAVAFYGPVWHLLLQIAQGRRRLSLTFAVRGVLRSLVALVWYALVVITIPAALLGLIESLWSVHPTAVGEALAWSRQYLVIVLTLGLLWVPWIALRTRVPFRQAVARNLELLRAHWLDLVIFALRYLLLMLPLEVVQATFSTFWAGPAASLIGHLAGLITGLLSLLTVALLYLELERATPPGAVSSWRPLLPALRDGLRAFQQAGADEPMRYRRLP